LREKTEENQKLSANQVAYLNNNNSRSKISSSFSFSYKSLSTYATNPLFSSIFHLNSFFYLL